MGKRFKKLKKPITAKLKTTISNLITVYDQTTKSGTDNISNVCPYSNTSCMDHSSDGCQNNIMCPCYKGYYGSKSYYNCGSGNCSETIKENVRKGILGMAVSGNAGKYKDPLKSTCSDGAKSDGISFAYCVRDQCYTYDKGLYPNTFDSQKGMAAKEEYCKGASLKGDTRLWSSMPLLSTCKLISDSPAISNKSPSAVTYETNTPTTVPAVYIDPNDPVELIRWNQHVFDQNIDNCGGEKDHAYVNDKVECHYDVTKFNDDNVVATFLDKYANVDDINNNGNNQPAINALLTTYCAKPVSIDTDGKSLCSYQDTSGNWAKNCSKLYQATNRGDDDNKLVATTCSNFYTSNPPSQLGMAENICQQFDDNAPCSAGNTCITDVSPGISIECACLERSNYQNYQFVMGNTSVIETSANCWWEPCTNGNASYLQPYGAGIPTETCNDVNICQQINNANNASNSTITFDDDTSDISCQQTSPGSSGGGGGGGGGGSDDGSDDNKTIELVIIGGVAVIAILIVVLVYSKRK